jgi:hypothetical protein
VAPAPRSARWRPAYRSWWRWGPATVRTTAGWWRRGAGLAVKAGNLTAADLTRLVTDGSLATGAAEVAREMAAMPAPARIVARLAALARRPAP